MKKPLQTLYDCWWKCQAILSHACTLYNPTIVAKSIGTNYILIYKISKTNIELIGEWIIRMSNCVLIHSNIVCSVFRDHCAVLFSFVAVALLLNFSVFNTKITASSNIFNVCKFIIDVKISLDVRLTGLISYKIPLYKCVYTDHPIDKTLQSKSCDPECYLYAFDIEMTITTHNEIEQFEKTPEHMIKCSRGQAVVSPIDYVNTVRIVRLVVGNEWSSCIDICSIC